MLELDSLLKIPPYGLSPEEKSDKFLSAMTEAFRHHYECCEGFRRFCQRRGLGPTSTFSKPEDFPFMHVNAFKDNSDLLVSVERSSVKTTLQSSATSGVPSSVSIDKVTAKRQVQALASVIAHVLGKQRKPFLVADCAPTTENQKLLGARSAAVRGFLNLAHSVSYVMSNNSGVLALDRKSLLSACADAREKGEPVVLFGFTYVLYEHFVRPLLVSDSEFSLPPGSKVAHIGGWKKLEDQKIPRSKFNETVASICGIESGDVIDFYGFTEQMGVTYPDLGGGIKCTPAFSEVVVRDPTTLEPLPDGEIGLLEFLTPLPYSYPGIAVLTDDVGKIVSRGEFEKGVYGTQFQVTGRAKNAEVRGCGDILGDKLVASARAAQSSTSPALQKPFYLLSEGSNFYVPEDFLKPIDLESLPAKQDMGDVVSSLKEARVKLDSYSVDELITLIEAGSRAWSENESPLKVLRQQGLLFLVNWCSADNLRRLADRSLRMQRGYLDAFRPADGIGFSKRQLKAVPRGVVAHWLAGNVPLLGMLTLVQSILVRNANVLKAASTFSGVLPALLKPFKDLEVTTLYGKKLCGNDILNSIAIVYFHRDNEGVAQAMSQHADVRMAWGGREAIESIINLPRRFGCEDIVFGPKLSFAVVGKEKLATSNLVRKTARAIATDTSVFDQYACASPHTVFVERGGVAANPKEFGAVLAEELEKALVRIPKEAIDASTANNITKIRMRYELSGTIWQSKGTKWTILFDEGAAGLAEPVYSRVITLKPMDNVVEAAQFANKNIQTIGLGLSPLRKLQFSEVAALLGAERFPDLGRMTNFDSPWDGIFPMDRLVRWTSIGGPF